LKAFRRESYIHIDSTMASSIYIVNQKGEELAARHYRADISRSSFDNFRNKVIAQKETGQLPPVLILDSTTFMYVKHKNVFLIAATRGNPNSLMIFEYLFQKVRILKSYLGDDFNDESVTGNFTLVYELFDETMDYGYPQNCAVDVLKLYINLGDVKEASGDAPAGTLTSQITGAIDWRREGLKYRKNEVHIDVHEVISTTTSITGAVLRSEVAGKVMMRTQLTGMPECKFGLNDKLIMEKENTDNGGKKNQSVEIDDCTFHRCVRLGKFDTERTITFIPPDGEFELMRYRVNAPTQPFRIMPNIMEEGKTKLLVNLKVTGDFPDDKRATNVVIKIPMPSTTASANISVFRGRAKYEPTEHALVWRISNFPGLSETTLRAEVNLLPASREKPWVRAPISMDFQIPMHFASGVQVRFLKVYEKSGYTTERWVKYHTKAGDYQTKI
jgi:AP-2 complex subunit mu-1